MANSRNIVAVDLSKLSSDTRQAIESAQVPIPLPPARTKSMTFRFPEEKVAYWKKQSKITKETLTHRIERLLDSDVIPVI